MKEAAILRIVFTFQSDPIFNSVYVTGVYIFLSTAVSIWNEKLKALTLMEIIRRTQLVFFTQYSMLWKVIEVHTT